MVSASKPSERPRVTLVNTNRIQPPVAPIAFDYLHEPLVEAGFEPVLLDLCFADDWRAAIAEHQKQHQPRVWGLTLRNTEDTYFAGQMSFIDLVREMVQTIRAHSTAPIVAGGVGFSVMPERLLDYLGIDLGIIREGEVSFPALLGRLFAGLPHHDIPGLVYRVGREIRRNAPVDADLTQISAHRRGLVDNPRYFATGGMAGVETKRGCSRACVYCVEPLVKGRRIRPRTPGQIVDEIESLLARGVDVFHINDSEFNLDLKHAAAFCEELLRRLGGRVRWYAYGMPAPFNEAFASLMVRAGCVGMNFGVDSANARILRVIRRSFGRLHIEKAAQICRRVGLPYMMELLLGFPGEDAETVRDTIAFMKHIEAELVSVTAGVRVFPGTWLADYVRSEGLSPANLNLHGCVADNDDLLRPLFYLSSAIGPDPAAYIEECIGGDPRFFPTNATDMNYNANSSLTEAIAGGARGAYWSILARIYDERRSAAHAEAAQ